MTLDSRVAAPRVSTLTIHRDYQCAHAGACCTSGWEIPVERETALALDAALASGKLSLERTAFARRGTSRGSVRSTGDTATEGTTGVPALVVPPASPLPAEFAGVLATTAMGSAVDSGAGDCALYERAHGGLCALQRHCGHAALPLACRQFPRVTLHDARGVFVSLSHYCPTAAALLWRSDVPLAIDGDPPAFRPGTELAGLDARDVLPPLLRPGVLMTLQAVDAWESFLVGSCARDDLRIEQVLSIVAAAAEDLQAWRPADGPLERFATSIFRGRAAGSAQQVVAEAARDRDAAWMDQALRCVPVPLRRHLPAARPADAWSSAHDGLWSEHRGVIRRYVATRGFASWLLYQGGGVRSLVRGLLMAVGVLRSALMTRTTGPVGPGRLTEAIQASDLILVHLAAPDAIGSALAALESQPLIATTPGARAGRL